VIFLFIVVETPSELFDRDAYKTFTALSRDAPVVRLYEVECY
jgi:hypothetical protein